MIGSSSTRALTRSGVLALSDQALVSATNFITAVMIGRACGKPELGVYSLAWTLITISTGLISTLIGAPYTVFGPTMKRSRKRRYLGSILVHQSFLSASFALALCGATAAARWLGGLSDAMASVGFTTAAVIIFVSLREFVRTVSFTELRIGWALSVDLTSCVAQAATMLLLIHGHGLTVSRTYTMIAASSALATIGWLSLHRGTFLLDKRFYLADLKRNWEFGKWVLGSGLLWQASGYLFPWVLAAFHGEAVTGVWAACSAIVALGNPVLLGLSNYALPKISNVCAHDGAAAMKQQVQNFSLLFLVLLLPLVISVGLVGERLLAGIYGPGYGGTTAILALLALNLMAITVAKPYAQGLFCLERARTDTFVNLLWVGLMIVVGIPAIRRYGPQGAAATMVATSSIAVALKIIVFARAVRHHCHRSIHELRGALPAMPGTAHARLPD